VTVDPHLEEVVRYPAKARRAAAVRLVVTLGAFVTALVLMPSRWLVVIVFAGGSCFAGLVIFFSSWRQLRRQLAAAPPVPPGAVEVERRRARFREVGALLFALAFLLGAGWISALQDASFAWGLLFTAALLGADAAGDALVRWSVGRWEHRHGRVLTSLLLGEGEVFYVERGVRTA